jgi:hypothetical protein
MEQSTTKARLGDSKNCGVGPSQQKKIRLPVTRRPPGRPKKEDETPEVPQLHPVLVAAGVVVGMDSNFELRHWGACEYVTSEGELCAKKCVVRPGDELALCAVHRRSFRGKLRTKCLAPECKAYTLSYTGCCPLHALKTYAKTSLIRDKNRQMDDYLDTIL